jgi:hypothetical protein
MEILLGLIGTKTVAFGFASDNEFQSFEVCDFGLQTVKNLKGMSWKSKSSLNGHWLASPI